MNTTDLFSVFQIVRINLYLKFPVNVRTPLLILKMPLTADIGIKKRIIFFHSSASPRTRDHIYMLEQVCKRKQNTN
jgi:hypothetical protein